MLCSIRDCATSAEKHEYNPGSCKCNSYESVTGTKDISILSDDLSNYDWPEDSDDEITDIGSCKCNSCESVTGTKDISILSDDLSNYDWPEDSDDEITDIQNHVTSLSLNTDIKTSKIVTGPEDTDVCMKAIQNNSSVPLNGDNISNKKSNCDQIKDIQNNISLSPHTEYISNEGAINMSKDRNDEINETEKKSDTNNKSNNNARNNDCTENTDNDVMAKRAQQFYAEWKPVQKRETLKYNPHLLITSLVTYFPEFEENFLTASKHFQHFDGEFLYRILCALLNAENEDDLIYFDIYMRGCIQYKSLIEMMPQDVEKPLRSPANKSRKGCRKRFDSSESMPSKKPKPSPSATNQELKGFICSPVSLIINERNRLDVIQTIKVNDEITTADEPFLHALEFFGDHVLSWLSHLSWNELKALNPTATYLSPEDHCLAIYDNYLSKFTGHRLRSPEVIFSHDKITAQLRGFICYPMALIVNDNDKLDVIVTKRINANMATSDIIIVQALERLCANDLSRISQLPWMELKKLNTIDDAKSRTERIAEIWYNYVAKLSGHKVKSPTSIKGPPINS